jgi:hypothetical protein
MSAMDEWKPEAEVALPPPPMPESLVRRRRIDAALDEVELAVREARAALAQHDAQRLAQDKAGQALLEAVRNWIAAERQARGAMHVEEPE